MVDFKKQVSHMVDSNTYRKAIIEAIENFNFDYEVEGSQLWISNNYATDKFMHFLEKHRPNFDIDDISYDISKTGIFKDYGPNNSNEESMVLILKKQIPELSDEEIYFKASFDYNGVLHIVIHRDYSDK